MTSLLSDGLLVWSGGKHSKKHINGEAFYFSVHQGSGPVLCCPEGHVRVQQGYLVGACHVEEQACEVLERYQLRQRIQPLCRCPLCNGLLEPVDKESIRHRLLQKTAHHYQHFQRCSGCDRLYWQGSHYKKMDRWVKSLKGQS